MLPGRPLAHPKRRYRLLSIPGAGGGPRARALCLSRLAAHSLSRRASPPSLQQPRRRSVSPSFTPRQRPGGAPGPRGVGRGAGMDAWCAAWQALGLLLAYPALVVAAWTVRSAWQGWRLRRLPSPPHGALGVVGALVARRDRHRLVLEWARALGPVFHIRSLFRQTIVCTDPGIVAEAVRCRQLDKGVTTPFVNKVGCFSLSVRIGQFTPCLVCKAPCNVLDVMTTFLALCTALSTGVQFLSSRSHPSLVSIQSNEHWKAIRKEAAACFSTANMKRSYPDIRAACQQLIDVVKRLEPVPVVDFDDALCRESLDVIGMHLLQTQTEA